MRRIALLAASLIFCLASCHKEKANPPAPSYPVKVGKAAQKPFDIFIEALGHIESITSIQIRSRIEGELTGIFFNQGQEVRKGDLLFTIDPRPFEAALMQARGGLEETLANLALAEEKVKRYRTLAKDEYLSQIDYETLQANVAALKGQKELYQGQVDSALVNLNYCYLYAPIDGKTGILKVDYGNLVFADSTDPLITLNQMAPIFVTFSVPEFQLQKIRKYQKMNSLKVIAAFEEFGQETFSGELYMIDNEVDPQTGMIKIRSIFPNEERDLWPGQFIRTRLILTTIQDGVVIPFTAIQMTPNGPLVFTVTEEMRVEARQVKLGQRNGDEILVLDGIHPEETIVIEGQINLADGVKVFIPNEVKR